MKKIYDMMRVKKKYNKVEFKLDEFQYVEQLEKLE